MQKIIPSLDGLRALAIVLVMGLHARVPGFFSGFLGVDIFFVLSGFLITRILITEWDATKDIRIGKFYFRRFLRLIPALCLLLAVYFLVVVLFAKDRLAYLADIPIVLFYFANWPLAFGLERPLAMQHAWSLSVEEQYYLIWPFVLYLMLSRGITRRKQLLLVLLGGGLLTLTRVILSVLQYPASRIFNGLDTRADLLIYGGALALWLACGKGSSRLAERKYLPDIILALSLLAGTAAYLLSGTRTGHFLYGIPLCGAATAGIIWVLVASKGARLAWALSLPPIRHVGKISYGLYLWHYPIGRILREVPFTGAHWQAVFALTLVFSFAAAELSYRLVEQPFLDLKERYAYGKA